jgi:hypothetical protein
MFGFRRVIEQSGYYVLYGLTASGVDKRLYGKFRCGINNQIYRLKKAQQ